MPKDEQVKREDFMRTCPKVTLPKWDKQNLPVSIETESKIIALTRLALHVRSFISGSNHYLNDL